MKWMLTVASALVASVLALPGAALAQEADIEGDPSCRDAAGSWTVTWTIQTTDVAADQQVTELIVDVNDSMVAPSLTLADFDASLAVNGNTTGTGTTAYAAGDDPASNEYGAVAANNEFTADIQHIRWEDSLGGIVDQDDPDNHHTSILTQPGFCVVAVCEDGDILEVPVNEPPVSDTGNCEPVRICVEGESQTVSEFEAEQIEGATAGSCVPFEPPPALSITTTQPMPRTAIEPPEEATPASEEAVALPAAGYGDARGADTWLAAIGLTFAIFGAATALMARQSR